MITETSSKGAIRDRARWANQTVAEVRDLRAQGVPVIGYTWFPLFTMIDWAYRRGRRPMADYLLHLGLYECALDSDGTLRRQSTPLVAHFQSLMREPIPEIGEAQAAPESAAALTGALVSTGIG